ncbi:glycerol-3-phosphate responsive antiterminator [Psychrobacillus vulpis]|uniref:Glycerol uptake operon antiterminator regulatory protein n=1 Tax=Psychrobacillus vulpis TaxID=2325572 RepID=A0A544TSE6_9BACI|nr:glycerol-3-phosphate responsive antiterminator [Psychrobacillus vulpis]TQR20369.1 glycerol-3-phosphate responsive antiterminator [Psychrobacillus vulpis]
MSLVDMVESQMIASVTNEEDLKYALESKANIVFLLTGNLMTITNYISQLKKAGKYVFVHLDFIDGISNSKNALTFVAENWKPTGIITTKSHIVKIANEIGLKTIQRIFLLDRSAVSKGIEMVNSCRPNAVEVLPGIMPKIIDQLSTELEFPIIAGGLIDDISEVHQALKSGALAVSSGNPEMWNFDL